MPKFSTSAPVRFAGMHVQQYLLLLMMQQNTPQLQPYQLMQLKIAQHGACRLGVTVKQVNNVSASTA